MLKPKNHTFKLKVMLSKLEAVSNKVASRCHATLRIDNDELTFKATPQLKKNVAMFNSQVEIQNYSLLFDEITGLYENKSALLVLEIETQGTKVKIGEVPINMGSILNEKKYRIVNQFPLTKCYDKTAKVKLSVDFIPVSVPAEQPSNTDRKERRENTPRQAPIANSGVKQNLMGSPSGQQINVWKQSNYKSRLAQQSNFILQQKIYEYEQKMDNYRLSQTQLQEKLHQQIGSKDDQITELTIEVNRRAQHINSLTLEGEQMKFRIKELNQQNTGLRENNKSLNGIIQGLQHQEQTLRKESQALKSSLENIGKTKQNKEKYFSQELSKYTARYLESEQERNKIVFELETKFKEEMEKKEANYRAMAANSERKLNQNITSLKQKIKGLENQLVEREDAIERHQSEVKKLSELLAARNKQISEQRIKNEELRTQNAKLSKSQNNLNHQLQTLQFSYHELQRETDKFKQELQLSKKTYQQLKMQLMMANQTIDQQRKSITKFNKELQVHQERQYYLTEKYNNQIEEKSINQGNIRGESNYYREEIYKLKNQLRISEERYEEESHKNAMLAESFSRLQIQAANKNQNLIRLGEERIMLESENKSIREELVEMEEALLMLKEENLQMNDYLRDKKVALENDKSLEWSYKIEELQRDISQMVEKFKVEKDLLKDNYRKEENKRKQEINTLQTIVKKGREDNQELKRTMGRKDIYVKQLQKSIEQLKQMTKDRNNQLGDQREKLRTSNNEKQDLLKKIKNLQENGEQRIKQMQQKQQKQLKNAKKTDIVKANFNKIITHLLQYLTKPYQTPLSYQQLSITQIDMEIANMVNLSLRRYCQERGRLREYIKKLQSDNSNDKFQNSRSSQKDIYSKYKEKRIVTEDNDVFIKSSNRFYNTGEFDNWKVKQNVNSSGARDQYEVESLREENNKLKRDIAEFKVKIKNIEEEVLKAERNTDSEKQAKQTVMHQLEELHDQFEKVNFQLKKKEKMLIEYQSQLKELQTEVLQIKNSQAFSSTPAKGLSRAEMKMREKEESTLQNRNNIVIKDLEGKMESRNREIAELTTELNKNKNQNSILKQHAESMMSDIKMLEAKLKQKTAKISTKQQQFSQHKSHTQQQYQKQLTKQRQIQQDLQQQIAEKQQQFKRSQQVISILEKQVQDSQKKIKSIKEDCRLSQNKLKREAEMVVNRHKDAITELETTIMALKAEIQMLNTRNKELTTKVSNITNLMAKKSQQLQTCKSSLSAKIRDLLQRDESAEQLKSQWMSKLGHQQEHIQQLQQSLTNKEYELEQYRFTAQGRLMDLQKRLQQAMNVYDKKP